MSNSTSLLRCWRRRFAGDLVFPAEGYLGTQYTAGIVFIQITWNVGRTTEVKLLQRGR